MGTMINGVWQDETNKQQRGAYRRARSIIRNWITCNEEGEYPAQKDRYHLYIAEACPWAHRTRIFRKLKGLEDIISMSIVSPLQTDQGWVFDNNSSRYCDHLLQRTALHQVYSDGFQKYTGRVTVPVLWDKQTNTIVNNESSEIIRMFNSSFDEITGNTVDFYPEALRDEIDGFNERIYDGLNNGVYRTGFSGTQDDYESAVMNVFDTLDWLEKHLKKRRYLCGDRITEADWRLFPTLVRFDVAYVSAFKCNLRRLVEYPNLWAYTRDLYQYPGIAETVFPEIYKLNYHSIPIAIGHSSILPIGPIIDLNEPHNRASLSC